MTATWRRRTLTYLLAVGFLVSIFLCVAFYLLPSTLQAPPNLGGPGSPGYPQRLAYYDSWYYARLDYKQDYAFSVASALVCGIGSVVSVVPKAAQRVSFVLLNVYFAWTAHVVSDISQPLAHQLTNVISIQDELLWNALNLRNITGDTQVVVDIEGLAALALLIGLTALLNLDKGKKRALLLSAQVGALSMVILGVDIAVFDYREFYLHVTDIQLALHLAPWFNNADLLLSGIIALIASTSMLRLRRAAPQVC